MEEQKVETIGLKPAKTVNQYTVDEFFNLPNLSTQKAQIKVKIFGQKKYENGELKTITEDKEILVSYGYWDAVYRKQGNSEPVDPQELLGYTLNGVYSDFKK